MSTQESDWDDIDSIQRQTLKPTQRKPRERIPKSVHTVIEDVDAYIEMGGYLTEKKFRGVAEEDKPLEETSHIQASLEAMSLWQSLCVPISR